MRFTGFVLGALMLCAVCSAAEPTTIYLGPRATDIERHAAIELQRFIFHATKQPPAIRQVDAVSLADRGVVLGTPETLPALPAAWPFGLEVPGADGYIIHTERADNRLVIVAAPLPTGVQNGVYGLLEEFGFGFYLEEQTLREDVPDLAKFDIPAMSLSKTPAFAVRGTLPWHSYFAGPTSWEFEDYQTYIDRLVRMRFNLVAFHSDDTDPFTAYEWDGALVQGDPLPNTASAAFGARPLATEKFLTGTGRYFHDGRFGAGSSFLEDREAAIADAKQVLRRAMEYAKGRGLQVCLGFEVWGDVLDPQVHSRFETRLRQILADYPMVDYLWLWQPEGKAIHPEEDPPGRTAWSSYTQRWSDSFSDVADPRRRSEASRMTLFAMHGRQVLNAVRPDVGLVVAGWGGDTWLRFTDFLPGMDKLLPEDIVLSGLDTYRVAPSVSAAYGQLGAERSRWPVIWFEYDGDLWMPQPNLYEVAGACRDAASKGCQGLIGLHWRTRAVEESAAYCARFAWNPDLTVEAFCEQRARDFFGDDLAPTLTPLLLRLQGLGYRWVEGRGQTEGELFSWSAGEEENRAELARILAELRAALGQAEQTGLQRVRDLLPVPVPVPVVPEAVTEIIPDFTLGLKDTLRDMLTSGRVRSDRHQRLQELTEAIAFVLALDQSADTFLSRGPFDSLLDEEDVEGALTMIADSRLSDALHTYARGIKTKGELGVLASMNLKAWGDLRRRLGVPDDGLTELEALPAALAGQTTLLVLPDRVIVPYMQDSNLRVRVQARRLGERRWDSEWLEPMGGATYALRFPEDFAEEGNFEWGLEVLSGRRVRAVWPAGFPTQTRVATALSPTTPAPPAPPESTPVEPVNPRFTVSPENYSVQLTWDTQPGEIYEIARDTAVLGATCDGWFEDTTPPSGVQVRYAITARNLLTGHKATRFLPVDVPELPLPDPPMDIRVVTREGRIVLGWESDAAQASRYLVVKYDEDDAIVGEAEVDAEYGHFLLYSEPMDFDADRTYAVVGVTPDGRRGEPSRRVGAIASLAPMTPLVQLSFEDESFLEGLAQVAENALALGGGGWAELPPQPEWNPVRELTVSLWVKLDDLAGMPVLLCKGTWRQSGYFVQIFREQVRFYIAGVGTLDAGKPQSGVWQHIAATYGFGEMQIYLNGELAGRKRVAGRPRPSANPLLVGRYGLSEDVYFVRGKMDEIAIYNVALTPQEVQRLYAESRPD